MIRKLTPADRDVYLQMTHEFYHSPVVLHAVPDEYLQRGFDEMMRSDQYMQCMLLEHEGQIAGYALLSKTYSQEAGGICVWIEEIYVRPEFRQKGLGKTFFEALERIQPAARYRLEIEPDNQRAERLYRSLGFEPLPYRQMVKDRPQ